MIVIVRKPIGFATARGSHWADPTPGQGRSARAKELAEAVDLDTLCLACNKVWQATIALLIDEDEHSSPELRGMCARELVRLSVLRRSIQLAKRSFS